MPSGSLDGSMGDVHSEGNPHYWLDPENGILIAQLIRDRLIRVDSANKAEYEANFLRFKQDIETKLIGWKASLSTFQSKQFITYHKVWSYFFKAFGLTTFGELEPLPGIPPSVRHLDKLSKSLDGKNTILLMTNFYPEKHGRQFADRVHAKFVSVPSNVGKGIDSYDKLFDYIIKEIIK